METRRLSPLIVSLAQLQQASRKVCQPCEKRQLCGDICYAEIYAVRERVIFSTALYPFDIPIAAEVSHGRWTPFDRQLPHLMKLRYRRIPHISSSYNLENVCILC